MQIINSFKHAGLQQNDFYFLNPKKMLRVMQFILIL